MRKQVKTKSCCTIRKGAVAKAGDAGLSRLVSRIEALEVKSNATAVVLRSIVKACRFILGK